MKEKQNNNRGKFRIERFMSSPNELQIVEPVKPVEPESAQDVQELSQNTSIEENIDK